MPHMQKHRLIRRLRDLNPLEDVPAEDSAENQQRTQIETLFCSSEQSRVGQPELQPIISNVFQVIAWFAQKPQLQ